ncbi:MAG: signal recognition particle protein Srp19 [Thermoprotei archaeon]|nr:MAG: signal recognition particle protein Srp19 [Thermoprotei archaeon]
MGRKVPLSLAIENPTIKDILEACRELNLYCEAEEEPRYPRMWHIHRGRVKVRYTGSKTQLLRNIAKAIISIKQRNKGV